MDIKIAAEPKIGSTLYPEYNVIEKYYGDRRTARYGVPLIHHIDEGLTVLKHLGSSEDSQRAYCLHPLLQADPELAANFDLPGIEGATHVNPRAVALALEYRNVANRALLHNYRGAVTISPLPEVNNMLIADKVQNRKDFKRYHYETHPETAALQEYFDTWLLALGISETRYQELVHVIASG